MRKTYFSKIQSLVWKKKTLLVAGGVILLALAGAIHTFRVPISYFLWGATRLERLSLVFNPNDEQLLFAVGDYYFGNGTYDIAKAETYLRQTIITNPDHLFARYQLGRVYFIQGNFRAALLEFAEALRIDPQYKRTYYVRGLVYGYRKDYALAAADFQEFLTWQPESWAGYNDLGWIYFEMGEYGEALETYEKGLARFPHNIWLNTAYGATLLNMDRPGEALAALRRAEAYVRHFSPEDWGGAYPGNDPRIYARGLDTMKETIEKNIALAEEAIARPSRQK